MNTQTSLIVLTGPTGAGKSSLGIKLAKEIGGYIINADSKQVYKDLKIGTAQPAPDSINNDGSWEIDGVRHYLYGFRELKEGYDIATYQKDVNSILARQKGTPILVGGSGMYIESVVRGYTLGQDEHMEELRSLSKEQLQTRVGKEALGNLNESDRENPRRLIRLIEKGNAKTVEKDTPLSHLYLVLDPGVEELKEQIVQRVDRMLEDGLLQENEQLMEHSVDYEQTSMRTIGYQEFAPYFQGTATLEEVREQIINHTNQYAKRQRTWFRRVEDAKQIKTYKGALELTGNFLSTL